MFDNSTCLKFQDFCGRWKIYQWCRHTPRNGLLMSNPQWELRYLAEYLKTSSAISAASRYFSLSPGNTVNISCEGACSLDATDAVLSHAAFPGDSQRPVKFPDQGIAEELIQFLQMLMWRCRRWTGMGIVRYLTTPGSNPTGLFWITSLRKGRRSESLWFKINLLDFNLVFVRYLTVPF